ncbi:hypothetical protein CDD81_607 [Ophiocordyceps australis]|uniref:Uncharacterized protein n=1 Tax=Ophiocordyceps australis TaxID=1399860 RepID=A0A2C5YFL2_9HYPO|nr:hypothetical protein CDD81_607 [Ophiocordyceps australis]
MAGSAAVKRGRVLQADLAAGATELPCSHPHLGSSTHGAPCAHAMTCHASIPPSTGSARQWSDMLDSFDCMLHVPVQGRLCSAGAAPAQSFQCMQAGAVAGRHPASLCLAVRTAARLVSLDRSTTAAATGFQGRRCSAIFAERLSTAKSKPVCGLSTLLAAFATGRAHYTSWRGPATEFLPLLSTRLSR